MSAILSFEEMKLWRTSTEKLTLEEFAKKLGKSVEAKKETHDLYDIVKNKIHEPVEIKPKEIKKPVQVQVVKQEIKQPVPKVEIKVQPPIQHEVKPEILPEVVIKETPLVEVKIEEPKKLAVKLTFKKKLSEREEIVLNHLIQNKGRIVLIKELADLLSLPKDYVYKYIKNLRNKIEQDVLVNAEDGGYSINI